MAEVIVKASFNANFFSHVFIYNELNAGNVSLSAHF